MKNHENEIIGVLQLINAKDRATGRDRRRSREADQRLAESLASQAAIALTNRLLINQLENLFESFINLINDGDRRQVALHRRPLPARAGADHDAGRGGQRTRRPGRSRASRMTDKDRYELKIAGLLHDCGKVTTPVHVVDKATKLQTIFDRIELIDTRFEVIKRDAEIAMMRLRGAARFATAGGDGAELDQAFRERLREIDEDREFLRACNIGGEAHAARGPGARARDRAQVPLDERATARRSIS